jgi:hypothetical protein
MAKFVLRFVGRFVYVLPPVDATEGAYVLAINPKADASLSSDPQIHQHEVSMRSGRTSRSLVNCEITISDGGPTFTLDEKRGSPSNVVIPRLENLSPNAVFNRQCLTPSPNGLVSAVINLAVGNAVPLHAANPDELVVFKRSDGQGAISTILNGSLLADTIEVSINTDGNELQMRVKKATEQSAEAWTIRSDGLGPTTVNFSNECDKSGSSRDGEFRAYYGVLKNPPDSGARLVPQLQDAGPPGGFKNGCWLVCAVNNVPS